jgi:hypothetical protein
MLNRATISLLITNTIPLLGVLFFGWNAAMLLILYWFENVVVGLYTIPKIAMAQLPSTLFQSTYTSILGKKVDHEPAGTIAFFLVHFGSFTFAHGMIVFSIFASSFELSETLIIAGISMLVSHGVSFIFNYIGNREYERTNANKQMIAPYKRVMIMHLTLLVSAGIVLSTSQSTFGLLVLVLLKTGLDLVGHLFEHIGGDSYKLKPRAEKLLIRIYSFFQKHLSNKLRKSIPGSTSSPTFGNFNQQTLHNLFIYFVESGKFEEIAPSMDPHDVAKIKQYYQQHSSSKQTQNSPIRNNNLHKETNLS